ncbi:IgGFc-binding protein-like [Mixophyes fleayi]|uniref:IgGFc-binding protein-like n=1 Tax=Mixophyes fleayi TaxID=3061075 RepID=UPI003F4DC4C8
MGFHRIVQLCAWISLCCEIGWTGQVGKEFITTCMNNALTITSDPRHELRISALEDNTNVTVTVFGGSYSRSLILQSRITVSVQLPASVEIRGSVTFIISVYVKSNKPITVSVLCYKFQSAETSIVCPLERLGTEYYLFTPKTGSSGSSKVFSVVASKEEASVAIKVKAATQLNGRRYEANSIINVLLPQFHGVQLMSAGDQSGTRVTSSKPVAVLSGHTSAQKNTRSNHVYEQLQCVPNWGTSYLVPSLSFQPNTDIVNVVAAGKTEVTYSTNGTQRKENMEAGQVLEIETSRLPLKIEASNSVQVTYFNTGGRARLYVYNPFLMTIPDVNSYCSSYYIYGQRGIDNYAIMIAENSATGGITFNGRPLINPQWTAIPGTGYSSLEYNFGNSFTSHKVDHPTSKFGLLSVGIGALFSYGTLGSCLKDPGPPPPTCRTILCAPRQVCVMENGKPKCVRQKMDVCWATGDPHFCSFDNVYYDFMGTCTYTLASFCGAVEEGLPTFTILIKNDNRGNVRVSYVSQVTFKTGIHTIVVKKQEVGYVRVDDCLKQLPASMINGTLRLFQSGNSVVIQLGNDMLLSYDWNHNLRVELSRRYAGKICGMCGNYNQNPADDFQTPSATIAPDAIAFGASWVVPDNTFCWHDCRGPCLKCPANSAQKYTTDGYCGLIGKKDGPFSECHAVADPKMYMENCVFDVCVNGGFKKISCDAVQAYAATCQNAGVNITSWREAAGCPLPCKGNSTYKLCGNACPATCQDPEGSALCIDPCVETCECNPGFVLSEGKCIPRGSCGCSYNGFSYASNEAFWNDTVCRQRCVCNGQTQKVECKDSPCRVEEECVVKKGLLGCYPKSSGVCSASGDPHHISYDGTKFDFQGTCIYQLTGLCDLSRQLTDFRVWVRNQNRGNVRVSYITAVYIHVYGYEIQLSRQNPNKVMFNNLLINLPYKSPDGRVTMYRNPCSAVVNLDFGVSITFDYNSVVRVKVPGTYANALCGLCGNFNGKPGDDLTPKGGTDITDATTFGKSWKVQELYRCRDDGSPVCPTLSSEEKRQRDGASECGILISRQGPFRDCHALVDAESYFKSCVYDYCILQKRQTVYCSDITSYVMACQAAGGTVYPWRTPNFCPFSCPDHSSYEVCADPCPVTCNGLSTPDGCDGNCTEGCSCNSGFILSGGKCVPISECGCNYNDAYYSVGESIYVGDSCTQRCTCTEGGIMNCITSSCSSDEECRVEKGVLGCHPLGSAVCTAAGYSHYQTFDSRSYDFQGFCSYALAQSCEDNAAGSDRKLTEFKVILKIKRQDSDAGIMESVTVEVHQINLTLTQGQKGVIQVNGVASRLPVTLLAGEVRAECYGKGTMVKTSFGLVVTYDLKQHVTISVPSNYRNRVCGLCGNYNENAEDDLGVPPVEVNEFGNKWKLPGDPEEGCDGCGSTDNPCPSCSEPKKKIFSQNLNCGVIGDTNGPFAKCHALVDPTPFLNDCISDLCQTNGEDRNVLCSSVAVYADACKQAGVEDINWRTDGFCPMACWPHSHYAVCADMCSTTCASITDTYECSDRCDEGCECDEGYVFDGQGCIPLSECGCFDNGRYYQAYETVLNDDCTQACTCDPISGVICQNKTCAEGEKCEIVDGVRTCVNTDPCKSKTCRLKESCKLQDGIAVCVPDYTGICWAWGDPHCHSLDGIDYDFQGTCSYVFAQYAGDDPTLVPFKIVIKNDNRGNQAVSYVKRVDISIFGVKISIEVGKFPQITVDDELTNLPVSLAGGKVKASQSGFTAVVEIVGGIVVTYEWNWHVTVTLPSSYHNSTSGLCGNFNLDLSDEQKTPNGNLVSSIIEWAGSWKEYDRDPFCFDNCPGQCPTCDEDKKQQYGGDKSCGIIFKADGPFRECIPKVSPNKFFDDCLFDVCMNDGAKNILCQALETYASTCLQEGVKLYDWRTPSGCPKICEDVNSHYNACGNACPAYCSERNAPAKCTKSCVETCECNDKMVLSGDKCVPLSSCGCQYNGRYYEPNQSWYDEKCTVLCKCDPAVGVVVCQQVKCKDSESCMVVNGIRGCYPTEYATCTASGDPHYVTFDIKRFDYMGTCIYRMVEVTSSDLSLTPFNISVQNDHRGNKAVSFTKDVILEVYDITVTMSRDYPQQIKVDGVLMSLPFYYESTKIVAFTSGANVIVKLDIDLTMTFDGWSNLVIRLPSTYKAAVNGLCGNYNGDPSDDFTIDEGVIAKTPEELGNHWKVGEVEGCTAECSDCSKCSEKEKEVYKGDQHCGLLTKPDGPFSQCYSSIDPTPYFDNCVFDACAYKGHQPIVCASIASYVSECQRNGHIINEWRTPSFCEMTCPKNSHYGLLGDGCPATCFGLTTPPACVKSQTEGCYCNNGFILSGQDCVPVPECGCVYGNTYYKLGLEFYTDNLCRRKCTCGQNGITTCVDSSCGENDECKVVDGVLGCHAKEFGQCVAWGDPHYITFDLVYYDFQGTCSYILVRIQTDRVNFLVTVDNEPYGSVAVTKSVTVTYEGHVIRLERERAWTIVVNGERYNLPCQSENRICWVTEEGNNVIFHTKAGFKVLFDRQYYVSVWVPSSFSGLTEGLCGNYNKDSTDDFRRPDGTRVTDPAVFGASWARARDGSNCQGCTGDQCSTCTEAKSIEAKSPTKCGLITDLQGPFKDCHVLVPPENYAKSCVYDVCAGHDGQDALCANLQAYTALCQEKGAKIGAWRDSASCPHVCQSNSHYEQCTRTCDSTCSGLLAQSFCTSRCFEGCQCDPGYVFDGDKCVTMDICGCNFNGRYLKAGESVVSEDCSQRCSCQSGVVSCASISCAANEVCQVREGLRSCQPRESQCTLSADYHFTTFDGVSGTFPTEGSYVMSSTCSKNANEHFIIVVDVRKCRGRTSNGITLHIFTSQGLISVNGEQEIWLNGRELEGSSVLGDGAVNIMLSRTEISIELHELVRVRLNLNGKVTLIVKEKLAGDLCGPCGNFNGDANDDLRLKNGDLSMDIEYTVRSWTARYLTTCSV